MFFIVEYFLFICSSLSNYFSFLFFPFPFTERTCVATLYSFPLSIPFLSNFFLRISIWLSVPPLCLHFLLSYLLFALLFPTHPSLITIPVFIPSPFTSSASHICFSNPFLPPFLLSPSSSSFPSSSPSSFSTSSDLWLSSSSNLNIFLFYLLKEEGKRRRDNGWGRRKTARWIITRIKGKRKRNC